MEQIETAEIRERSKLPAMEPRWDPEKAGKRKVRIAKVPHGLDPMKEKTVFEFGGFVYICYAKKTRGRSMIRCLGMAEIEPDPKIMDATLASKALSDSIDDDVMKEAQAESLVPPTPFEAGTLLDQAEDDVKMQGIGEVAGDGQSIGPDETPNP